MNHSFRLRPERVMGSRSQSTSGRTIIRSVIIGSCWLFATVGSVVENRGFVSEETMMEIK